MSSHFFLCNVVKTESRFCTQRKLQIMKFFPANIHEVKLVLHQVLLDVILSIAFHLSLYFPQIC